MTLQEILEKKLTHKLPEKLVWITFTNNKGYTRKEILRTDWQVKQEPRVIWVNEFHTSSVAYNSKEEAEAVPGINKISCRKYIEVLGNE